MSEVKKKFFELYNEVFDENDNVTACGRETCKKLIAAANAVKPRKKGYYGDLETGQMNVSVLIESRDKWR